MLERHGLDRGTVGALSLVAGLGLLALFGCSDTGYYSVQPHDPSKQVLAGDPVPVNETFLARFTQQTDLLAVIDNSGSMDDKIKAVKDNLDSFHQILNSRRLNNYRFAGVTVDVVGNSGTLLNYNGSDIVDSGNADPVTAVKNILGTVTTSAHSYWEQGMVASQAALTKNGSRFLRPGADLAVITMTDADDYSCKDAVTGASTGMNCLSAANASNGGQPETIATLWTPIPTSAFKTYYKSLNRSVLYYAMVGTPDRSCNEEHKGLRYIELQQLMGTGFLKPICVDTIASNFLQIASDISARGDCYHLQSTVFSGDSVRVSVNKVAVATDAQAGFVFDGASNSVCFRGTYLPPAGALISIDYNKTP